MCFIFSFSDSHGQIDPSLRPLWDLAFLGSSYVMWEKTTQFLNYYLIQISSVKQLVRSWKLAGSAESQWTRCSCLTFMARVLIKFHSFSKYLSYCNGSGIVLGIEEGAVNKTTFVDFSETQFWKEANKPTNMGPTVVGSATELKRKWGGGNTGPW